MGSLRDQLIRKGLADSKRARKVRHDEENRKKKLGEGALAEEQRAREEEQRAAAERKRLEDQQREEERRQQQAEQSEADRIPRLIRERQVEISPYANRRFYFVTRENTVSFLSVTPAIGRSLADGRYAIVESGGAVRGDYCVVEADAAREIAAHESARVLFLNDAQESRPRRSSR